MHFVFRVRDWSIDFLLAFDGNDIEGILSCLYDIDAPYDVMMDWKKTLESDILNKGLSYSNKELKRSVVVIPPISSGKEFIDSFIDDICEVSSAITGMD